MTVLGKLVIPGWVSGSSIADRSGGRVLDSSAGSHSSGTGPGLLPVSVDSNGCESLSVVEFGGANAVRLSPVTLMDSCNVSSSGTCSSNLVF